MLSLELFGKYLRVLVSLLVKSLCPGRYFKLASSIANPKATSSQLHGIPDIIVDQSNLAPITPVPPSGFKLHLYL
jgi:hypothetical protein